MVEMPWENSLSYADIYTEARVPVPEGWFPEPFSGRLIL
jgi:hypothetical protein